MEIVLGGLALDVARLVREFGAEWVDALAVRLEDRGHGMLCEPVDFNLRMERSQLGRDGNVSLRVA
jgi:hypothetical protein